MSTNSTINILNEDGTVDSIYCHWDGYLEFNGKLLQQHYTSEAKVRELISNGDLSILGSEIGEAHDFDYRYKNDGEKEPGTDNWCMYFGRDRGERNVDYQTLANADMVKGSQQYNYLFRDGSWTVNFNSSNVWVGLRRAIDKCNMREVA